MSVEHPAKTDITVNLAIAAAVYTTVTALFVYLVDHYEVVLEILSLSFESNEQSVKVLFAFVACLLFVWYLGNLMREVRFAQKSLWSEFKTSKSNEQQSTSTASASASASTEKEEVADSSLMTSNNIKIEKMEQSVATESDKTVIKTVITVQNNLSDGDD